MVKYLLTACFITTSSMSHANILPVITRALTKSSIVTTLVPRSCRFANSSGGFKISREEILKALFEREKDLVAQLRVCTEDKNRENIKEQLGWIIQAIDRMKNKSEDSEAR